MSRLALVLCLPFLSLGACAQQQTKFPIPGAQQAPTPTQPKAVLPEINPIPGYTLSEDAVALVGQPDIAADLKLTKEEIKATAQVFVDLDKQIQALTKQSASDAAFDKASKNAVDRVLSLLNPAEVERLKQIGLQAMGWDSFRIDEVRKGVFLTPDQTNALDRSFKDMDAQVDAYSSELGDRMSKLKEPAPGAKDEDVKAFQKAQEDILLDLKPKADALTEQKKKGYSDFLASLNGSQQDKWKAMQGAPFAG